MEQTPDQPKYGMFRKDGTPRRRSNQFIAAKRSAMAKETAEDLRQKIRIGMVLQKLHRAVQGKEDLSPTQVQSCKILMDKAIPTLQSVEQTITEPAAVLDESALFKQLQELLAAFPDMRAKLIEGESERVQDVTDHDAAQQTALEPPESNTQEP